MLFRSRDNYTSTCENTTYRLFPLLTNLTLEFVGGVYVWRAYFGYRLEQPQVFGQPIAPGNNSFEPAPFNRSQVDTFSAGTHVGVFSVDWTDGQPITWTVVGPDNVARNVTATPFATYAPTPVPTPVPTAPLCSTLSLDACLAEPTCFRDNYTSTCENTTYRLLPLLTDRKSVV